MSVRSQESRRISMLLVERRVSSGAMAAVLSVALFFGLIGFAWHTLWIVAIVGQEHREVVEQREKEAE
jgi:hypothetical protein